MTRYLLIDPILEQAVKGVLANQFGITARNAFRLRSREIPFKAL